MGLVTVLYVFVKVSLFLPQWVGHEERGFVCPELGKFASGRVG